MCRAKPSDAKETRALIFDSYYDDLPRSNPLVRVVDGAIHKGSLIKNDGNQGCGNST